MRLLAPLLLLAACADEPTPTESVDSLWTTMDERYGPFAQRGVDWDAIGDQAFAAVDDEMGDDALAAVMEAMLAPLDDGHLNLARPDALVYRSNRTYRERIDDELFDLDVVRSLLEGWSTNDAGDYTHGTLCGARYLHLAGTRDQAMMVPHVLDAGDEPLILDLRHARGGDFTWAFEALARTTDVERPVFRSRSRIGPERDAFSEWDTFALEPDGDVHDDRPIALLIDRYTISAAERMAMAVGTLPQATVLGVPTNGAQATMATHVLANGWVLTLPVQEVEGVDGEVYEGPGYPPDIEVQTTREALDQGVDAVLDAALDALGLSCDPSDGA
ncbi:MAG: hypothetical protein EP330_01900 [Deltaproteobacteria bacterium]|nr:MAG: hypothetical protein EP330_01900 [Deltaproteobacteria bacterium]